MSVARYLGADPKLENGGSTNCNRAIEAGLQAVCIGIGEGYDSQCHTLDERFNPEGAYDLAQQTLLLALLCAGTEEVESIIE